MFCFAKTGNYGIIMIMKIARMHDTEVIADALNKGGVVVLRTDTIYGIVTRADNSENVDRVFALKQRDADKSCIVLIANEAQMWDQVSREAYVAAKKLLDDTYPTSVIVPVGEKTPEWLKHHDEVQDDVAFRIPSTQNWLVDVLKSAGPLIAPSANVQSQPPAANISEAYEYFGDGVDLYVDGGTVEAAEPSHLYRVRDGQAERLR